MWPALPSKKGWLREGATAAPQTRADYDVPEIIRDLDSAIRSSFGSGCESQPVDDRFGMPARKDGDPWEEFTKSENHNAK